MIRGTPLDRGGECHLRTLNLTWSGWFQAGNNRRWLQKDRFQLGIKKILFSLKKKNKTLPPLIVEAGPVIVEHLEHTGYRDVSWGTGRETVSELLVKWAKIFSMSRGHSKPLPGGALWVSSCFVLSKPPLLLRPLPTLPWDEACPASVSPWGYTLKGSARSSPGISPKPDSFLRGTLAPTPWIITFFPHLVAYRKV